MRVRGLKIDGIFIAKRKKMCMGVKVIETINYDKRYLVESTGRKSIE